MKTVELTGVCGAARDHFKGLLSLGLEVLATYTENGDHWAGGLRKQNLKKSPLSIVNFISTKERREKDRKERAISRAQDFDTLEMDEVIQEERGKGGGNGLGLTAQGQCTAECTALPHPETVK